jgi:hypothetical protein
MNQFLTQDVESTPAIGNLSDQYLSIYRAIDKLNSIEEVNTASRTEDEDEVTHLVFFGENIKRLGYLFS